ncbi:MAG: AmmeMemoRadiSam system radical SAM enzyme [Planctomycetes bacterium]|nr:AmmeMemoRadiSam system radical SAM enzyme [Planctomycetota bacterium]
MALNGLDRADLWESDAEGAVHCLLCSHGCRIPAGRVGLCHVRENREGVLYTRAFQRLCSAGADPIEKKPLFHFLPGTQTLSIASLGCNFKCEFCQNWQISQACVSDVPEGHRADPEAIVQAALDQGCKSLAYTYTEPTVFMELCAACGTLARTRGLKNVFVSNGFMTRKAIEYAMPWLDGINIDLKAFDPAFYSSACRANLEGVLASIEMIARETDLWMEITTLVIPGQNDDEDQLKRLVEFLVNKAGPDRPWHVSRFHPQYRWSDVSCTSQQTLEKAVEIGKAGGLNYVYMGNLTGVDSESTRCPQCDTLLIQRQGYRILANHLKQGQCPTCALQVPGILA